MPKSLIFLLVIITSCQSQGNLQILGDFSNSLKEVSAVELYTNPNELWVIQDSGDKNVVYLVDSTARIKNSIKIKNAINRDWEDLTFDTHGNLYVGDFGNNNKEHIVYTIYRIDGKELIKKEATSKKIEFTLPQLDNPKDFEAFFIYKNTFYIFSKENNEFSVYKVPNEIGRHEAVLLTTYNLPGKHNKITSADIDEDNRMIVLLNHKHLWVLSDFNDDKFFSGSIEKLKFDHDSQKEGICFKSSSEVILTDERNASYGGDLYKFKISGNTGLSKQ